MASKGAKGPAKRALYPMLKRKLPPAIDEHLPPLSGLYDGRFDSADLELKIDVDKLREFSAVLNIISGSITKTSGNFPWIQSFTGLYFRSIAGSVQVNRQPDGPNNETELSCSIQATRDDGEIFCGRIDIFLRLPQDDGVWNGSLKIAIDGESVTFEDVFRKSQFFRQIAIDIDYVERVVWPTITLADFYNTPADIKDRKLDPFAVFEDAGVKLIYEDEDSDKIKDSTPSNPWTKHDMYDVMMTNFDDCEDADATIWCMVATKPPDERFMGFSFDKNGRRGFGMFTGHKSFDGLFDEKSENHVHASRRFLHYFVHECGHTLGLEHPFEIGRPKDLTWMNYAWKYDQRHGPGQFYKHFTYTFTDAEQAVIRHSPSKAFNLAKSASVRVGNYGVTKTLPADTNLDDYMEAADDEEEEIQRLSLRVKVRPEPYPAGDLVELEVRIKNEGQVPTMVEKELDIESGNMTLFITDPDGSVKQGDSFVRPITGTGATKALILYPNGGDEGSDRYSQMIRIGEGRNGSLFSKPGTYAVRATYTAGLRNIISNTLVVVIIEADKDTAELSAINTASLLGGSSSSRFKSAAEEWKRIAGLPAEKKKTLVNRFISVVEGLTKSDARAASVGAKKGKKRKKKMVKSNPAAVTYKDFLTGTDDLVQYYHEKGTKDDNMPYKALVFARGKLSSKQEGYNADADYNQLLADLVSRGLKYSAIKSLSDEWQAMRAPTSQVNRTFADYLQKRVDDILDWYPTKQLNVQNDLSGLGLGKILSHFDKDHVAATSKIVLILFNKLDETNDLNDVLDYADSLQRGYQVNHQVLQWAVEIFIIHSKLAKKSGILYPLPKDKDSSIAEDAAMVVTQRTGSPRETWMNYWRCDADLNYHHRHWHSVYVVGREIGGNIDWFGRWRDSRPELERQGELFGYMHQQMLARYDAERESWGLNPVRAWSYNGRDSLGFNAGFEFHNDPRNANMSPRPPASWPRFQADRFIQQENNYHRAVNDGVLPPVFVAGTRQAQRFPMDGNLAGHVIEASSSTWRDTIGSIHNSGHGVFGSNQVPGGGSYMLSTVTAMRDPIFYRWHRHVDNLWQDWNRTQVMEIGTDAPPVHIRPQDIVMSLNDRPMDNFASFGESYSSDVMRTGLGPATKRYEWDNKLSHDPFYYHIRFRRIAPGTLNLTFRIFICPARHMNNRENWIEMDKFVYRLDSNQETAAIIRPDRHSSVIKREPRHMDGNVETGSTNMTSGFCECGWPYSMLLPRGTERGEDWRLCVFISDNNIDSIGVRSSCGSLSFCGASGEAYPDLRPMGYPFTTDVSVNGREVSIQNALGSLPNTAVTSFVIRNNVSTSPPSPLVDMWSPWVQLGLDDGTQPISSEVTEFRPSGIRIRRSLRMRVLIDDVAMHPNNLNRTGRVAVRFQGRGDGNGSYRIIAATVGTRLGTTPNVRIDAPSPTLTVNGQTSFEVPETGVITDEVQIRPGGSDLFVTFTLGRSPGSYLSGSQNQNTNTFAIFDAVGDAATSDTWSTLSGVRQTSTFYCVGGVMVPIP